VEFLLDAALTALSESDWAMVDQRAQMVLALDPENDEAARLIAAARIAAGGGETGYTPLRVPAPSEPQRSLREVLDHVIELVPFPGVASKIIAQLDDETGTIDELARLISSDPALTVRLLRVANSAYYGRRHTVGTTREAIVLLGAAEVRALSLATCLVGATRAPSVVSRTDFWRFAITVALLSDLLARTGGSMRGDAFTAGLLHNIGLLALDLYSPEDLRSALTLQLPTARRLHDRELIVFGFTDAELGAALAREWRLPDAIVDAIANHGARPDELAPADFLASCVVRSRILARSHGLSDGAEASAPHPPPTEWTKPPLHTSLQRMGGIDGIVARVELLLEQSM
jgi:HD-like signal output (HDOD) protein